jgi:spore coat protein CotH
MRASRVLTATLALAVLAASPLSTQTVPTGPTTDDFFNPLVLHRIDLLMNSKDWEKLKANYETNEYYPANFKWNTSTVYNVGIRSRGLGSRSESKPGLRVDMNRYTSGQTFLGLEAFDLDNLWQDSSGMKEAISMRVYARLNLPAPRETFAKLYVNNVYQGLYGVVEEIDKDFLKRVYGETNGDTENDGFLFEYNWLYPWYFTHLGTDLAAYEELLSAKTHENDSDFDKYHDIEQWVLTTSEARDDMFVDSVSKYIDLATFMKTVSAESFMAEWDGIVGYAGMANFYLYRFEKTTRHQFLIWDSDNTFRAADYPILQGHRENVLMNRSMGVPSLSEAFFQGLLDAATSAEEIDPAEIPLPGEAPKGWLEREIDRTLALIQQAMYTDPNKPYTNQEFDEATVALRTFARERGAFVRCEVAKESRLIEKGPDCF